MNQTIRKIEGILTSQYSSTNYTDLIREIFPSVKIIAPDRFMKEYTNFSSHIEGYAHVGNYTDPNGKSLIIHAVQLKKESYVENSRSTQRSYAKKLIEAGNADAAIVAFYTDDDPKWRLSFVRLDYEIKFENGKLNTTENMTPAKRYSYLVGQDEPCHTAISRFRRFITDDPNVAQPTLDDLEEAFSVEKVTEEFFQLYCEKFHQLRESLEANEDFVTEAKEHNFTSAQFAKKLMGQIVFLYFLQKKGWMGVGAWTTPLTKKQYDNVFFTQGAKGRVIKEYLPKVYVQTGSDEYRLNVRALDEIPDDAEELIANHLPGRKTWGSGSKQFMRGLFNVSKKKGGNFFDDYLEPLFYDALNINRGEQGYDPTLHCRIPFLSGGLFEPIDGYDWRHNDFAIPNKIFSNKKDENDREANGILDIFDRYNFTMSEDEPLEREVAIDPEMLGKVFENLLEVQDRKSKGAFYTPREIVHYMCQETLISYLIKETGLKEQDIRDFILLGDFLKDEDTVKERRQGEHDMYISEDIYKIDKEGNVVVDRLVDIDNALANIRVADPAVGSGAFPLGMLNEIVRARQNISAYMAITQNAYQTRMMYNNERSPYNLKLQTIKNCIFAADIEPSAVDIAQLRLWLSLVIDDEINPEAQSPLDGHRNPIPLPNLECNIVCGNSLIDEFEGIKLVNYSDTISTSRSNQQRNLLQSAFDAVLPSLLKAQDALFRCDDTVKKQELKEQIDALKEEIISSQMQVVEEGTLERYHAAKREASKPFVLWQIDFARVFKEKGGFDVVIGNPPYVGEKGHKDIFDPINKSSLGRRFHIGRMDLFYYFFHRGIDLCKEGGILSFITTNYYITADGGVNLRKDFYKRTYLKRLINFNEISIFETAKGQHNMITFLIKTADNNKPTFVFNAEKNSSLSDKEQINRILSYNYEKYTKAKKEVLYDGPQYYIRTSLADEGQAQLQTSIVNKMLLSTEPLGSICNVNQGARTGADKVTDAHIKKTGIDYTKGDGIFVLTQQEAETKGMLENEMLKPWFKNSDIRKYYTERESKYYVIYSYNDEILEPENKVVKEHLEQFKPILQRRDSSYPWYQMDRPRKKEIFIGEKIISPQRSKTNVFAYNKGEWFSSADVYYITPRRNSTVSLVYIIALLNSKLFYYWLYTRGKRKGEMLELYQTPLSEIPIRLSTSQIASEIVELTEEILENESAIDGNQKLIDQKVYELYDLTDEEREYVNSFYEEKNGPL